MVSQEHVTGAKVIAQTLKDLGVKVIFGLVGVPVSDIAEQAINIGIRFIGFRNEQAASYAATAYGYLTGRPGVCLVVGGPGVLHAIAGVGNASQNNFPMLLLGGSIETHMVTKGAFQELDSVSLLTPHTKLAIRVPNAASVPSIITNAYRCAFYGRGGCGFVDLPADIINDPLSAEDVEDVIQTPKVPDPPKSSCDEQRLGIIVELVKNAKAPLILIGKGAAYARAETVIRHLIDETHIPFLPSPMGKGVVPDSHPDSVSSARSAALKMADVVLILGARLNWIFHHGEPPKWNPAAKFIQVDISAEEMGRNAADAELSLLGDINIVVSQLSSKLAGWKYNASVSDYTSQLRQSKLKNETISLKAAAESAMPLTYARAFSIIKSVLHSLSPPSDGGICYIAEGANTMDISRSIFPLEHPRLRLDAGTYATMGVGLPYAIAAWEAYNAPNAPLLPGPIDPHSTEAKKRKKIVAIQGDSAFGFSALELETASRMGMDLLIFVINNSGIYFGDANSAASYRVKQEKTKRNEKGGLRSWALGWETRYEMLAEMCGGKGYFVRSEEELGKAVREGWGCGGVVVVNVVIGSGRMEKANFGWQATPKRKARPSANL